jgi:hypothetical protein
MSNVEASEPPPFATWQRFAKRNAGNPFLVSDPLYALSQEIIDAIKVQVPSFFTKVQERFERDLAKMASFGFVHRRVVGRTEDDEVTGVGGRPSLEEREEKTAAKINELLAEELKQTGADDDEVNDYFKGRAELRERTVARKAAYAGWLILNPHYRTEVQAIRKKWGEKVSDIDQFPRLPMWALPDPTDTVKLPKGFREDFYDFLIGWGLDTLLTWDWPIPMEPDLNFGLRERMDHLTSAGMILFVPWYMLRGWKLDVREVVQQSRIVSTPDHLQHWVNKRSVKKGDDLGDVRYATVRWLYRYHELALMQRHEKACRRNLQRLDRAFANVIKREVDTVKKLRKELWRAVGRNTHGKLPS